MKTKINCQYCNAEHYVEQKEINRGGGKYCSLKCAATHSNTTRRYHNLKCQNPECSKLFTSKNSKSKYCSKRCCSKNNRATVGKTYCTRSVLSNRVRKLIGDSNFKCFICGWNESTCDIHHINPRCSKGTNDPNNLTVLCPNHHRLADRGLLNKIPTVSDRVRTISSSSI